MAAGVSPAMRAEYILGPDATLHADVMAAWDQEQALELELRREDGTVIPTSDIGIIDTHYLLSIPDSMDEEEDEYELTPEQEAEIEEIVAEFRAEAWSRPAVDEERRRRRSSAVPGAGSADRSVRGSVRLDWAQRLVSSRN
jgi:hypothetical protein